MHPNTGQLYDTVEDAKADGVENPVELVGRMQDIDRIADAVKAAARKKKRRQQKLSRKANRP